MQVISILVGYVCERLLKQTFISSLCPQIIKTSRVAKSCHESNFSTVRAEAPINIKSEQPLKLMKNPLEWSVSEVGEFLQTTDCADRELVARLRTEVNYITNVAITV